MKNVIPPIAIDNKPNELFLRFMFLVLLIGGLMTFTGCSSMPRAEDVTEENARKAAEYIRTQEGLIQNTISKIVHLAIYKIPEGTDKQPIIDKVHVISSNLNSVIISGETNPAEIRASFKTGDADFDLIFAAAGEIVNAEIQSLKKNGYGDLSIEILKAVSRGIADGTAQ